MSLGAGFLEKEGLPKERQEIIKNIENLVKEFRVYAFENKREDFNVENVYEMNRYPTNFISLLGHRGSGKTSMLMTIHKKLLRDRKKTEKNIVLNIIDPAKFNVEENALGWIIYLFEEATQKLIKNNELGYCNSKSCIKNLKQSYEKLKDTYVKSRPYYRSGSKNLSGGTFEYKNINRDIIFSDMNLENMFRTFIDTFIDAVKMERGSVQNICDNEPLIFITFDDIDISPEHGHKILRSVLNYLKHPNIVVFILGKYKTFKEGIIIDSLHRERIYELDLNKSYVHKTRSMIQERKIRAEEFMEKVLPFSYRYDLEGLSISDRLNFKPYGDDRENSIGEYFETISFFNHADKMGEESHYIGSMLDLFFRKNSNFEFIEKEYRALKEEKNSYRTSKNDIDRFLNMIENKEYEKVSVYTTALFENPRGLINFHQRLRMELVETMFYHSSKSKNYMENYNSKRERYDQNFRFLYRLYNCLKNNVKILDGNCDVDKIFKIDMERKRVFFDFENIVITSDAVKQEDGFIFSSNIVNMSMKSDDKSRDSKIELNSTQSAFIQFFYDLSYFLLGEEYIKIQKDKTLAGLSIYRDEKEYLDIRLIEFNYFYEYYMFMEMLEMFHPIIVKDRNTSRGVRDRLQVFCLYAMEIISGKNFCNSSYIDYKEWIRSKKDLRAHEFIFRGKKYENEEFIDELKKLYGISINDKYFGDGAIRDYNLFEFAKYFSELENEIVYNFKTIIESDEKLKIYAKLIEFISNKLETKARNKKIEDILSATEVEDDKLLELSESIGENEGWENIKKRLEGIRLELLKLVIERINKENDLNKYRNILDEMLNSTYDSAMINEYKILIKETDRKKAKNESEKLLGGVDNFIDIRIGSVYEELRNMLGRIYKQLEKCKIGIKKNRYRNFILKEYDFKKYKKNHKEIDELEKQFLNYEKNIRDMDFYMIDIEIYGETVEKERSYKSAEKGLIIKKMEVQSLIKKIRDLYNRLEEDIKYKSIDRIMHVEPEMKSESELVEENILDKIEEKLSNMDLVSLKKYFSEKSIFKLRRIMLLNAKHRGCTEKVRISIKEFIEGLGDLEADEYLKSIKETVELLDSEGLNGNKARSLGTKYIISGLKKLMDEEITNE